MFVTAFAAFIAIVLVVQLLTGDETWISHLSRTIDDK